MNEIIIYESKTNQIQVEVGFDGNTVWLNRNQLSTLLKSDVKTIGKYINNVFNEGELEKSSTVTFFAKVQNEGGRKVERKIEHYNLHFLSFPNKG